MDLTEKIKILKNTMVILAQRICNQNPEYREMKGRLDVLLELQQEQQQQQPIKKEETK